MSISSINSSAATQANFTARKKSGGDTTQEFLDYMKQTPAQRIQDNWLRSHGLTREKFESLRPEKKKALLEKMQAEMEEKLKREAQRKALLAQHF